MICIYHSRDLDGWMSAAIVKLKFPDVELIGWDYGNDVDFMKKFESKELIFVDISPSAKNLLYLASFNNVTWIDHHISAIKDMEEHAPNIDFPGLRDTKFAACELTWQYFFPNEPMPEIVRLLGRYDCFGHKGTEEELRVLEFQYGARANYFDPETCYQALKDWDSNLEHSIQIAGYNIYNYLCTEAQQTYARRFDVDFDGYKFGCVNDVRFNPINFGIEYHRDGYDGFACFHYQEGQWIYSLYNDNGLVDCSVICKKRGGGGHKGASGFQTKELILR